MDVGDPIKLSLTCTAKIIGRTYEQDPKVDVQTPWGTLNAIPWSILRSMAEPIDESSAKVEVMPPAKRVRAPHTSYVSTQARSVASK